MATLGELLRRGREAKGLSLQAVSNATKIREHILVSLESDNYTALPAPVFVRGFLRTLARHLSLNSDELMALYAAVTSPAEAPEPEVAPAKLHPAKSQPIKVQPVKLQPTNGQAPTSRLSRLLSSNGHGSEVKSEKPLPANGHSAEAKPPEPAPSNGHLTELQPAKAQSSNGHETKPTTLVSAPLNGHAAEPTPTQIVPLNGNGHVPEPTPVIPLNGNSHALEPTPTQVIPLNGNGHSVDPKPATRAPLNGHKTEPAPKKAVAAAPQTDEAPPVAPSLRPRPTLTLVRPPWMTANVLMSGLIALLLIAGVAWGGGRMIEGLQTSKPVKALQDAQPTLAAMIQIDPTATPPSTPVPTDVPPTAIPTVPVVAPSAPSPLPVSRTLEIKLDATARTWVQVESDGTQAFTGIIDAGASKGFIAHSRITMRAGNGGGVNVTVNGKLLGLLGAAGDVVDKAWVINDAGAVATATPVWANPPEAAVSPTPAK